MNVQLDCGPDVKLDTEMQEMRAQYEALILKNSKQIEEWFQTKVNYLLVKWCMDGLMDGWKTSYEAV